MAKAPLRTVRSSGLFDLYRRLSDKQELSDAEKSTLLAVAVMLLNETETISVALGYRIIVLYSNLTNDFEPLYDVALSRGFMPIVQSTSRTHLGTQGEDHFFPNYFSSLLEQYEVGNAVFTEQQIALNSFFEDNDSMDVVVVAPTSYGKSELISKFCNRNPNQIICVVVPTKALLAQTKQRLLSGLADGDTRRVITHAEMFHGGSEKFIAVLTQERLLRFFTEHPDLRFDTLVVDEAHNLLGEDQRSLLLAKVVILHKRKNEESSVKFLTPFLNNEENIRPRYIELTPKNFSVRESLKAERYTVVDFRSGDEKKYDQYFDKFWLKGMIEDTSEEAYIIRTSARKNIIFFNSPKKIERFVGSFINFLMPVGSKALDRVCETISDFLHTEYLLVNGLRKGVLYHHGSVPDIVKLYAERAFSEISGINYIVCNSTLLEGVNIPAEKMFLLEFKKGNRNLSQPQFRNLVGRICRFSEIFDRETGSLGLLEPEVVLVGSERFIAPNANLEKLLTSVAKVDAKLKEPMENVLLEEKLIEEDDRDEKRQADEFLEAVLPGVTGLEVARPSTEVGRACLLNNISEIDILRYEVSMQGILNEIDGQLTTSNEILHAISEVFVPFFKPARAYDVARRLEQESARKFYAMLIDWRSRNASYQEMIANFIRYWNESDSDEVYVGKWGEYAREGSFRESWIDISEKSYSEQVNLAIVRIKEEQDFVDNSILKFVEVLNDLGKVPEELYLQIKYGTTSSEKIRLINNGLNSALAGRLVDIYSDYVETAEESETVYLRPELIEKMRENGENEILVFEAGLHMGLRHDFID